MLFRSNLRSEKAGLVCVSCLGVASYVDVLVKASDGGLHVLHRDQHVLDHVVLLVQTADGFSLGQLQQGDLRRNHPPKQPAEHWVVTERDDILEREHTHVRQGCCL